MTNLTEEEQHDFANYNAACQKGHENVTEDTNTLVKKSEKNMRWKLNVLLAFALICGTYLTTAFLGKNVGLPIAFNGDSIDGLRDTALQKEERARLFEGILRNDPKIMDTAKMVVRTRPDGITRGAEFTDLTPHDRQQVIATSFRLSHIRVLEWVKKQPFWANGLDRDTVNMVLHGPARNGGLTIEDWKKKYYTMKNHHKEMEHDDDYAALRKTEKELAISQSKLNAMLAFIHDDPYYWNKVDPTHLGEKWGAGYATRIEQAPRMKKHLGLDVENKKATTKIGD